MISVRPRRTRLLLLFLGLWAAVVVGRLAQIQIAQGGKYRARAQRQQERRIEVSPRRGSILDREGRELAVSVESFSVYAIPEEVDRADGVAEALSLIVKQPGPALAEKLSRRKPF